MSILPNDINSAANVWGKRMDASHNLRKYEQTKRWLYIFSIVTIAAAALGISIAPEGEISGIRFALQNNVQVLDLLSLVVLVLLIRSLLEWTDLGVVDRKKTFNIIDHWLSASFGAGSLLACGLQKFPQTNSITWIFACALFGLFQVILLARLAVLPLLIDRICEVVIGPHERKPDELRRLAELVPYKLYFNPDDPTLFKLITFSPGGQITVGQNSNEHTWRIRGSRLEILNSQGQVFSSFRFRKRILAWVHTNALGTRSLKNQYLLIGG